MPSLSTLCFVSETHVVMVKSLSNNCLRENIVLLRAILFLIFDDLYILYLYYFLFIKKDIQSTVLLFIMHCTEH